MVWYAYLKLTFGAIFSLCIVHFSILLAAEKDDDFSNIQIFQKLYLLKRQEQKEAIKILLKYDYGKQYKLVETIGSKAIELLGECEVKLREGGYIPGMNFPSDENMRDVLSSYLENTAFMSEILLHLPDITHHFLKAEKARTLTFTWGIFFATQSNFIDKQTKKLVNLASQELGIAEKDPNYKNPYTNAKKQSSSSAEEVSKLKKRKKKKSFNKGPRLSGEL